MYIHKNINTTIGEMLHDYYQLERLIELFTLKIHNCNDSPYFNSAERSLVYKVSPLLSLKIFWTLFTSEKNVAA